MSDLVTSAEHATARRLAASTRSTAHFGVIVFLASDVMLFAPFFAAYFLLRANNPPWPPAGVELDVPRAALATLVLVASSFTLAASRPGRRAAGRRRGRCAAGCSSRSGSGRLFLANQIAEYATLGLRRRRPPLRLGVYWLLTGLHGAHVTAGIGAMVLLFARVGPRPRPPRRWRRGPAAISLFWHLVDVIWVLVFSTIWLLQ